MTTEKITGAHNFDSERELAAAFLARDKEIQQEEGDDKLVALGAAVKVQSLKDRAATRAEEKEQQQQIRNRAKDFLGLEAVTPTEPAAPAADTATPTPPVPPTDDAATEPATAPAAAAPPVAEPPASPPVTEPVAAPAVDGPEAIGLPAPTEVPPRRGFRVTIIAFFRSFGWGTTAWVLASIFGLIGLFITLMNYDGFFTERPEVLRILGVILITATSFFVGGTIGSNFDRRRTAVVVAHAHDTVA